MTQDFSFEDKITDGKVQIIRSFILDFDKIHIVFENSFTGHQKQLSFSKVISFSMLADFYDNYDSDMDNMAHRTLIGFSYVETKNTYEYCLKVDDYEITIKSLSFVDLTNGTY